MNKRMLGWIFALALLGELAAFLVLAATGTLARHGAALVAGIMVAHALLAGLAVGLVLRRRQACHGADVDGRAPE